MEKVSVKRAAELMGKSCQFIRIGLQRNLLPIGTAVETRPGRYSYYISPKLLSDYTGISKEQL